MEEGLFGWISELWLFVSCAPAPPNKTVQSVNVVTRFPMAAPVARESGPPKDAEPPVATKDRRGPAPDKNADQAKQGLRKAREKLELLQKKHKNSNTKANALGEQLTQVAMTNSSTEAKQYTAGKIREELRRLRSVVQPDLEGDIAKALGAVETLETTVTTHGKARAFLFKSDSFSNSRSFLNRREAAALRV
ncbi:hypothetical protein T484DRAFT_1976759 [Baffinella frigidus]|nr:hypothetical protein T484DRAFT_1976759 [Cryptophyta sp. CCMP2293]